MNDCQQHRQHQHQHQQHTPKLLLPTENTAENELQQNDNTINNSRSGRRRRRTRLASTTSQRRTRSPISVSSSLLLLLVICLLSDITTLPWFGTSSAFVAEIPLLSVSPSCSSSFSPRNIPGTNSCHRRRGKHNNNNASSSSSSTQFFLSPEALLPSTTTAVEATVGLSNYAPLATSLFNNMKLPAAVVTAGMISLGFATGFPELPKKSPSTGRGYPPELRARCESIKRLHIVVSLIAVTSELITVMWAAVEVNQLTEKQYALAYSVWDLIQRDCDLAWSAVNSHFVIGIMGFVTMLALRAYVMLLAVEASAALMTAASTGTGAALCLMISIVNRGVESGGGDGYRYGNTIFDLFSHYAELLFAAATNEVSPGPLQLAAIVLELTSLIFMANVLLFRNGKMEYKEEEEEDNDKDGMMKLLEMKQFSETIGENNVNEEECPLIDIVEIAAAPLSTNNNRPDSQVRVVVGGGGVNGSNNREPFFASTAGDTPRAKVARCLAMEEEQQKANRKQEQQEEDQRKLEEDEDESKWDAGDTSVGIY